jgi:hypothetical protein
MRELSREFKFFLGGFMTGFGWFIFMFLLGYYWELGKIRGF